MTSVDDVATELAANRASDKSDKSDKLRRRNAQLQSAIAKSNLQIRHLNAKNRTLVHALNQAHVPIPPDCLVTAGDASGEHEADVRPSVNGIAPPPEDVPAVPEGEEKYEMRMCNLPDTTTVDRATRFKPVGGGANASTWPHGMKPFSRTNDAMSPHVEKRKLQYVAFRLCDRTNKDLTVTEALLAPATIGTPRIGFKLDLLYDDTGESVALSALEKGQAQRLTSLTSPDNIFTGVWQMANGMVRITPFKLNLTSTMTNMNRKFRYRLRCVDADLSHHRRLTVDSPGFYCVAKATFTSKEYEAEEEEDADSTALAVRD
jgi:hypothetical protein